jgi:hypothetical protein
MGDGSWIMQRQYLTTVASAASPSELRAGGRKLGRVIRALEEENVGLRNTVVDLSLQVAVLRESLPAYAVGAKADGRIKVAHATRWRRDG